jgi:hypothetical protein
VELVDIENLWLDFWVSGEEGCCCLLGADVFGSDNVCDLKFL